MLKEVIKLNGLIIVIFIILYFAFKYLKAKDSEDNSGRYSRRPYNAGYPWNRVVPPQQDVPKDFKDGEGIEEEYEEGLGEESGEGFEDFPQVPEPEIQVPRVNIPQIPDPGKPAPQAPSQKIPEIEAPVPEAFGLKMPDSMSITTTEIVVDSEVQLDAEMSLDKLKK